ncbi:hypothetical protein DFH05DRAFT_1504791 [Lentinula detonsa]|uniref:C2H2-type domain-containing protein n=1 Tax=Lentinula detonsa TaxID=2804962 RepID=A0A9W8TUG1_9AGAR|nr:hypothetical protein DFH05DRAFT_1504791 [Lentinula detonsa]
MSTNMSTVGVRSAKPFVPVMQKDVPRLEEVFRHCLIVDPKTSRPLPTEKLDLLLREDATTTFQRSHEKVSLPSFREFHEASLGKFAGTTATFRWPSLKPSSNLEEPDMFRFFEKPLTSPKAGAGHSSSNCTSPAVTSTCTTPISEAGSLKRPRSEYDFGAGDEDNRSDTSRSSEMSPGYATPHTPFTFSKATSRGIRIVRTRKELFDDPHPWSSNTSDHLPSFYSHLTVMSRQKPGSSRKNLPLRISTDFTSPSITPEAVYTFKRSRGCPVDQLEALHGACCSPHKWATFAQQDERNIFKCRWEDCQYKAKKQLVKRHIETTHMRLKPFVCDFCGNKFPQRTSLNVHVASKHTHDKPYKCPYKDCDEAYNDPARLHRHKTDVHNYIPKSRECRETQDKIDDYVRSFQRLRAAPLGPRPS